jgi:hypothetical protein
MFWTFSSTDLPYAHSLEQQDSDTGDVCHHNLKGLTEKQANDWFKSRGCEPHHFRICTGNGADRQLTLADLQ